MKLVKTPRTIKRDRDEDNITEEQRNAKTQKAVVELVEIEQAKGHTIGPGYRLVNDEAEVCQESGMWEDVIEESKKEKDKRRLLERWADHKDMLILWYVQSMASHMPDIGLIHPEELPAACNCVQSTKRISFYMLLSNYC